MKYSMIAAALALAAPTFAAQAETITYTANSCEVSSGNAQRVLSKGYIENRTDDRSNITCHIPVAQNRDIQSVTVNYYINSLKPYQGSSCNINFFKAAKSSVVASGSTNKAVEGSNQTFAGPFYTAAEPSRGIMTCSLPGVLEGGLSRIYSYSVTYM